MSNGSDVFYICIFHHQQQQQQQQQKEGVSHPRVILSFGCLYFPWSTYVSSASFEGSNLEDEDATFPRNVRSQLLTDAASYTRRTESSATPMRKLHYSHRFCKNVKLLNLQAPCVLYMVYRDRSFAILQRTLFIYLFNKYISLSDICLTVHR